MTLVCPRESWCLCALVFEGLCGDDSQHQDTKTPKSSSDF